MNGLCQCGCGRRTSVATRNYHGIKKGAPMRYVAGHSSTHTINQVIKNTNWHDPNYVPPRQRGVVIRPKSAKLTPDDALAIRASSAPARELARHYGVSQTSINNVRRRVTFRYLP